MNGRQRVLVTGAGGFIGSALLGSLRADQQFDVFGLVSPRRESADSDGMMVADLRDPRAIDRILSSVRPDVVIHAGGRAHYLKGDSIDDLFAVNVGGTRHVGESAVRFGVRHLVHLSSVMVYGKVAGPIHEAAETNPLGEYAESKLAGEAALREAVGGEAVRLTILRLAMVPAVKNHSSLSDLSRSLAAGRFLWVGEGLNRKSLLTLSDVTRAVRRIIEHEGARGGVEVFNLESGSMTMSEVVETLAMGLGVKVPSFHLPVRLARAAANLLGGRMGVPSTERLEKFLSDDRVVSSKFQEAFRFAFEGDLRSAVLDYAREYRAAKCGDSG